MKKSRGIWSIHKILHTVSGAPNFFLFYTHSSTIIGRGVQKKISSLSDETPECEKKRGEPFPQFLLTQHFDGKPYVYMGFALFFKQNVIVFHLYVQDNPDFTKERSCCSSQSKNCWRQQKMTYTRGFCPILSSNSMESLCYGWGLSTNLPVGHRQKIFQVSLQNTVCA